jgi:RNA polymerase sigma-70 factor, ECF subfamily
VALQQGATWASGHPLGELAASLHTTCDLTLFGTAVSVGLVHESTDTGPLTAGDGELARAIACAPPGAAQAEESELYRRFARRVKLYGLKHLRDDAAAEDLVQQVLLVTIERLRAGEVRNPDQIGSFILGTSRMLTDSTGRKTRRRESLTAQFHVPELYAKPVAVSEDIEVVERCLHALAERDRRVLMLTFYAEKTSPEIAEELGVTGTVVRVARHRALERMRACVGLQKARKE